MTLVCCLTVVLGTKTSQRERERERESIMTACVSCRLYLLRDGLENLISRETFVFARCQNFPTHRETQTSTKFDFDTRFALQIQYKIKARGVFIRRNTVSTYINS